ncbi:hypothetical protein MBO_04914 [Moraxella bovoculi 237]|uniref:Uncharacterized protein n=1 Tax=Moraxella bovoculi 237 TaxID=743974 RepID=A0A066ULU2_9GAMM|nr:hypothetical protein [Moraxella bovoculi]KDN25124.1 hypothetical protein MBO_04914 [Moraxella bovoculi 237]
MRYGYRRQEGGFVLLIVLVAVLLVVGISALAIRQSLNDARLSFTTGKANELFVAADAPLAMVKDGWILTVDQGMLDKLISYHQNLPSDDNLVIAHLCYDLALGRGNFVPSRMVIAPASMTCQDNQVLLWLSLRASTGDADDFSHVPSGVPLDDLQMVDGVDLTNYHLTMHAFAAERQIGASCTGEPMQVKRCLTDEGVMHQMLVQEFYYGYE